MVDHNFSVNYSAGSNYVNRTVEDWVIFFATCSRHQTATVLSDNKER